MREKEAELAALDKELAGIFLKLDVLKRNGQVERVQAANATQRHIGFLRELLAARGSGSIAQEILAKGFSLRLEHRLSDFGSLVVLLESEDSEEAVRVYEDVFGAFNGDAYPSKEGLKNAFDDAYMRLSVIRNKKHAGDRLQEAHPGETIH